MALQHSSQHAPSQHGTKTLGESALCFGCAIGILALAAATLEFLMHLLP